MVEQGGQDAPLPEPHGTEKGAGEEVVLHVKSASGAVRASLAKRATLLNRTSVDGAQRAASSAKALTSPVITALAPPDDGEKLSLWQRVVRRVRASATAYVENVRRHPRLLLLPPTLTLLLCMSLGVYGVLAGASKEVRDNRDIVYGNALDWAAGWKLSLEQSFTPLVTLSIFIKQQPNYTEFEPLFPIVSQQVLASLPSKAIAELQVAPMGVIADLYPLGAVPDPYKRLNADIFAEPALRGGALVTIQQRQLVLNGPLVFVNGGIFGAIARLPIFIQNASLSDTFGTNRTLPTNCTTLCWNPVTREKFWGFVTSIIPMEALRNGTDPNLDMLKQKGLDYMMTRPWTSTEQNPDNSPVYIFANSSTMPVDPVSVDVVISNAVWTVYLAPHDGWQPAWRNGMLVLVTLGSTVLSIMVAVIMASWAQQSRLLGEVLASNDRFAKATAHLEEEKRRLDALLVRQYNLISVLGGPGHRGGSDGEGGAGDSTGPRESKEGLTLERIEAMRRQLAVNSNTSTADIESIQVVQLLGQGTFGKVYKGLWRGSVVAVKTMVLPANMSGAEKREKMAVMEAAISSSLSHPNIVQTYTYAIHAMRDDTTSATEETLNLIVGGATDTMNSASAHSAPERNSSMNVHSYEVRLVLEYCDKGSLRSALDAGAFMTDGHGLNYRAVLDIAADVAKAMLHLHSIQVLHSDLKSSNIMLKSDAQAGSGVIAKACDFGLALQLQHMETHISAVFQGTYTHMAPEVMLEGRASKAADVYSFGVTLWELFTGGHPFAGLPRALLGHKITREHLRPHFPALTPTPYRELAEACWHPIAEMRPSFEQVLSTLQRLRGVEGGTTPMLIIPIPMARSPVEAPTNPESDLGASGDWGGRGSGSVRGIIIRPALLPKIVEAVEGSEEGMTSSGGGADAPATPPTGGNHPQGTLSLPGADSSGSGSGPRDVTLPAAANGCGVNGGGGHGGGTPRLAHGRSNGRGPGHTSGVTRLPLPPAGIGRGKPEGIPRQPSSPSGAAAAAAAAAALGGEVTGSCMSNTEVPSGILVQPLVDSDF